jgi:hypothetical protein
MSDRTVEAKADNFVDQLRQIQGEYLQLTDLYEREKSYSQKLAELMKALQFEVDATIPLSPAAISTSFMGVSEAYLVSDSVVVAIDGNGVTTSKPLYRLTPESIISVVQDCTPQLYKLISEKRKRTLRRVNSLEKVVKELKRAQATFKQARPEDAEAEAEEPAEPEEIIEAPHEIQRETPVREAAPQVRAAAKEVEVPLPQIAKQPAKKAVASADAKDSFSFNGSFEESRNVDRVLAS